MLCHLSSRSAEVGSQFPASAGADVAQQVGHPPDLPAFGAKNVPVEIGDLIFNFRHRNDGIRIIAHRRAAGRNLPHALGCPLRSQRVMRQQSFGNLVLGLQQLSRRGRIAQRRDRGFKPFARRRQGRDQLGAACDQGHDTVDALAVVR
jgi:hypothetical protein